MKGPILPGKNLFSFLEGVVVGEGINEITLKLNSAESSFGLVDTLN
jgi:hypothetical protein